MQPNNPIPPDTGISEMPDATVESAEPETCAPASALDIQTADTRDIPEDSSMLDVHPPHEPIHTWKGYLLHMSTIVLGLLIAIGLEQSVEAVHRAHERQDLRESLRRDIEKAIIDAKSSEESESAPLKWLTARQQQVKQALATRSTLAGPVSRAPHVSSRMPIDPAWNAAKSSGRLSLLSQEEVQVFSEADILFAHVLEAHDEGVTASRRRGSFEWRYSDPKNLGIMDLSSLSPAEENHYLDLLIEEANAWDQYRVVCQYLRGAETAILSGDRDLSHIQKAELQFYTRVAR
jgi:hypothetical protein